MRKLVLFLCIMVLVFTVFAHGQVPDRWPIRGAGPENISSGFGNREDGYGGREGIHRAIDIAFPEGTPVYATHSGYVTDHWPAPDGYWTGHDVLGGCVILIGPDGWSTTYGHLSKTYVHEGSWVQKGELIGLVGNTGMSTGPHLHYEINIDPMRFINAQGYHPDGVDERYYTIDRLREKALRNG